mgnify:CR=1 FL=1
MVTTTRGGRIMSKGSGRRPTQITDAELEKAWNSIFNGHPSDAQFNKSTGNTILSKPTVDEDDYGNVLPSSMADKDKQPKPHKPRDYDLDRFVDDTGDA